MRLFMIGDIFFEGFRIELFADWIFEVAFGEGKFEFAFHLAEHRVELF